MTDETYCIEPRKAEESQGNLLNQGKPRVRLVAAAVVAGEVVDRTIVLRTPACGQAFAGSNFRR